MTRSKFSPRCRAQVEVVFDGRGAANSRPMNFEIDARDCTIGQNGFYEADTFDLEFDARILPFDPDQLAYAAVRIFMWDADKNLDQNEWAAEDNLMISGIVDEAESYVVGEDNIVKFSGRDYTGVLDPEWDPKIAIPSGDPLDQTIQAIADEAAPKGTRARFLVVWNGEQDPPRCGGLHKSTKKKGLHVKPGKTYWEVIWDLCIQHGYTARVEGATIIIEEPITQTKQTLAVAPRLIYGKTLLELSMKRKFAREKVPQIVLVASDPRTKRRIEVKYPDKRNIDVQVTASKSQGRDALGIPLTVKKDEVMYFPAPKGVVDQNALRRYARMRFYHLGRGETVYALKTNHLWISSVDSRGQEIPDQEFSPLRLRPGAAVGVKFDPFNQEHLRSLSIGQREDHIVSLGYSSQIASFVAGNLDRLDLFRQEYYFNRGNVTYNVDNGMEIEMECTNFASEVREVNFAHLSDEVDVVSSAA